MDTTNNTDVEIQVILQLNDLFKFNFSLLFRKAWYQFLFAMSVLGLITFPLSFTDSYIRAQPNILFTRIIVLLVVIALPTGIYLNLKKGFLTDKKVVEIFNFCFSNFGIECNSSSVSSNTYWNKVLKIEETKRYFWVFTSKDTAFILPKRCFKSKEQLSNVKELLNTKLNKKRLELKKTK